MYCTKRINNDLVWIGANDRRLAMFEGVYSVPNGVSYNSYLLTDDTTVLFDTVDRAVGAQFFENLAHELDGRSLDYIVIHHMEPDHAATLGELLEKHPETTVVCNAMIAGMIKQFFNIDVTPRAYIVKEGDTLNTGRHELTFINAPMVHWPEVMVTYDRTDKTLFSADAFGCFGALNGAIFADEVDFMRDYLDEARRYYTNIVGKYGTQVQTLLKKAASLDIRLLCPLHGFVWRRHIGDYIDKYAHWSTYTPEVKGVMIAYASVYGNTANAAEILACRLRDTGIDTAMYDVSVTPTSEIVSAAFKYSHLVFASTTYNAGIFISMDELLTDLVSHNLQNRTVAFIQNGSWAPTSGKLMRTKLSGLRGMTFFAETVDIRSALKSNQLHDIDVLANRLAASIKPVVAKPAEISSAEPVGKDPKAFFNFSYGLFVLSARDGDRDNACIINTAIQLTSSPERISIAVNKLNYTHDMIKSSGRFNLSVLSEDVPMHVFKCFGFRSGKTENKFDGDTAVERSSNGIYFLSEFANAVFSCRVLQSIDCGSHTLFIAEVDEAKVLSSVPSVTYAYYFAHIKPKPAPAAEDAPKKGFRCKICGYVYEGDTLPADFICPICKHGAADFEPIG